MALVEVALEGGPAHRQAGVTVRHGPDGTWPPELFLGDPAAPQHLYRFRELALTRERRPVYEYVKTVTATNEPV